MKIFNVFNEDIRKNALFAPLNHPNIDYGWSEELLEVNGKPSKIIFIGKIIDDANIDIVKINEQSIGFFDNNHNFVTPILFHEINLQKEDYKNLLDEIMNLENLRIIFNPQDSPSQDLISFINDLDNDVPLYMDVIAYIRNGKFDFSKHSNYSEKLLNSFVSFLKEKKTVIEEEYPHLKLMVNILD